jgi:hypothetical protein
MTVDAQAMVDAYLKAEAAVLSGQRYRLGDRDLTLADLSEIHAGCQECEARVSTSQPRPIYVRIT